MLYSLMFTPVIPAIIARVLSPAAGLPQRLLPQCLYQNEDPAVKSQSGVTLKVSLNFL